jgi:hypothetical protein
MDWLKGKFNRNTAPVVNSSGTPAPVVKPVETPAPDDKPVETPAPDVQVETPVASNFTLTQLCDELQNYFKKCINDTSIQECPELVINLTEHPEYETVLNTPTTYNNYSSSNDEVVKIDGIKVTKFREPKNYFNALKYEGKLYFFKVLETDGEQDKSNLGTKYYSSNNLPRVQIFEDGVFLSQLRNKKDTPETKLDGWQINLNAISPTKRLGKNSRYGGRKSRRSRKSKKQRKSRKQRNTRR